MTEAVVKDPQTLQPPSRNTCFIKTRTVHRNRHTCRQTRQAEIKRGPETDTDLETDMADREEK